MARFLGIKISKIVVAHQYKLYGITLISCMKNRRNSSICPTNKLHLKYALEFHKYSVYQTQCLSGLQSSLLINMSIVSLITFISFCVSNSLDSTTLHDIRVN